VYATANILPFRDIGWLFHSWPSTSAILGNIYLSVILTTILSFVFVGVCFIVKYASHVRNDIRNVISADLDNMAVNLWIAFILVIPYFFMAGVLWFVLWWFLVFWVYLTRSEKKLVMIFIFLVFISGWVAHVGGGFVTYESTHVDREIYMAENNMATPKDVIAISSWIASHPDDAEPMNTMALIEKRRGNFTHAVDLLKHALDLEPANARFYNNLSIALAGMSRYKEAVTALKDAIALNSRSVIYHYNLSRVYQKTYDLYDADKEFGLASKIDPERVNAFLAREGKDINHRFIEEKVPVSRLIYREMTPSEELNRVSEALWDMGFGVLKKAYAPGIGVVVCIVILILEHIPSERFTKRCSRCGRLYYVGASSSRGHPLCLQCHWLDMKSKKNLENVLTQKITEVKKYRLLRSAYTARLETIMPGLGSIVGDRTGIGVARICVLSLALVLIITGGQFIYSLVPSGLDTSPAVRMLGMTILGILYWRAYSRPPETKGV